MKILIIALDPNAINELRNFLQNLGHMVAESPSTAEAARLDLVLCADCILVDADYLSSQNSASNTAPSDRQTISRPSSSPHKCQSARDRPLRWRTG